MHPIFLPDEIEGQQEDALFGGGDDFDRNVTIRSLIIVDKKHNWKVGNFHGLCRRRRWLGP